MELTPALVLILGASGIALASTLLMAAAGNKSAAALFLFIVFLTFDVSFRDRGFGDKSLDPQVMAKLAIWAAAGAYALIRGRRFRAFFSQPVIAVWLLFFGWLAVSALYAPSPIFSAVAVAALFAIFAFFVVITDELDPGTIGFVVLMATGLICAVSLVGYFLSPDTMRLWSWANGAIVRTTRLVGITGHANAIGGVAAIGVLSARIFWGQMHHRSWLRAGAALTCAAALLLSQSRTSLGALLVVLALYQIRDIRGRARPMLVILIAGLFALGLILVSGYGANNALGWIARSGRVTEVLTLAGRTSIWSAAIDLWAERPLLGWGYGSGDFILPKLSYAIGFEISQTHSVFLQVLVASGLIGLTLFLVAIAVSIRSLVASRCAEGAALLGWALLVGLTESAPFVGTPDLPFAVLSLGIGIAARRARMVRKESRRRQSEPYSSTVRGNLVSNHRVDYP